MANKLELLSPAGSMDALKAALTNGADAVYLGAAAFGARASAGFSEEDLKSALDLAHLYRKKIYVTVNILVKDCELNDIRKTLKLLSALGADAVILQDLGVLKIVREEFPELPVHASTQMALHNASGARLLRSLGAQRVVLARECDLKEIAAVAATGIQTEVFCHGALCVSVSGQCLFSSMIGGRSGNRGRCAQPCRLSYRYQGKNGAWLSPRDLCTRDQLDQMARAGAYSFKIEGRLKRPEYVAVVTRAYRDALDKIQEGRFAPMDEQESEALTQIFSRGGFTKGYIGQKEDAGIIDESRVTPLGLPMGKVRRVHRKGGALLAEVPLLRPLHNGDGLEIGTQELRYSGPEIPAGSIAELRLREQTDIGGTVRRTEDENQLSRARTTYEGEAMDRTLAIPFDAVLSAFPETPLTLTVTDGENKVTVQGEVCHAAQNKALNEESAHRLLEKTGGTPFTLRSLRLKTAGAFVPAAALNALRREALEKLKDQRIQAHPHSQIPAQTFSVSEKPAVSPRLIVKTRELEEIPLLLSRGADQVLYAPMDYRAEALDHQLSRFPENTLLVLPVQCREDTLQRLRKSTQAHHIPVCVSSPGQMHLFPDAEMIGEGVPVMNGEAIRFLSALGFSRFTLSRETAKKDLACLPKDQGEIILPVYGRTRLMVLNHCPMRTLRHLTAGKENCRLCDSGCGTQGTALTDRKNASYPLLPYRLEEGCVVEMMADRPLHLSSYLQDVNGFSYLLTFTDETQEERLRLLSHYRSLLRGENPPVLSLSGTLGRFSDGVI